MNFRIFKIWEIIYKKVIITLIGVFTIWGIDWYLNLNDKSDTFIISTLYALFLFLIGIYINYMEDKIDDKFYERKDYYLVLLRLKDIFNSMSLDKCLEKDVIRAIISFKVFTNRADGMKDKGIQPYIPEKGFKFKYNELNIEDKFIRKRNNLLDRLNNNVMDYINKNSIATTVPYPHIDNLDFNIKEWCSKYCKLGDDKLKNMETYVYGLFSEFQDDMDELHLLMQKITKLYCFYRKKVALNIKRIENTYGKRLEYEFYKENQYVYEISSIRDIVQQIHDTMCSNDENEELSNDITELREDISSLYERIESLEDNLINEIDMAKDELLDK